jgi:drug/metabolite transporter (DMT)-like permease
VAIKLGLLDAPPVRLAWMRFVLGGLVIVLWGWRTGRAASFTVAPAEWRPCWCRVSSSPPRSD